MNKRTGSLGAVVGAAAWLLLAGAVLAGCSAGSDGVAGPAGPTGAGGPSGSPGPTGPILALDISTAKTVTATITRATIDSAGKPTVEFNLVDERGQPLSGLKATTIRFVSAKLKDPAHDGDSSTWESYINTTSTAGTVVVRQAYREPANTAGGVFKDNGDGTYSYAFAKNLGDYTAAQLLGTPAVQYAAVTYEPTKTHRVGLEIRGTGPIDPATGSATNNATGNPIYTWLPSTGAISGLVTRDIVSSKECFACHDKLAVHGGARNNPQYCVMCHNPGTTDATTGNTVDFKVFIHKIHMGNKLTAPFSIGAPPNDFVANAIAYPQDQRNCATCHVTTDAATPDAGNYLSVPNAEACGACHDSVNFGPYHAAHPATTNDTCIGCHGPNATVDPTHVRVADAHVIPEKVAATQFKFNILSVTDAVTGNNPVDGGQLKITFAVTDPTNSNAAYDLTTADAFTITDGSGKPVCSGTARLGLDVAWSTGDYTSFGSGSAVAQPWSFNPLAIVRGSAKDPTSLCSGEANATVTGPDTNNVFTLVTNKAGGLPAGIGTLSVVFEGHPAGDTLAVGTAAGTSWHPIPVTTAVSSPIAVNDTQAVARRQAVEIAKCDKCHNVLSLHGNNRTDNPQACVACHNSGATDAGRRKSIPAAPPATLGLSQGQGIDGLYEQPIDFKVMIHAIHAADFRKSQGAAAFVVYGFGSPLPSVHDFSEVGFPGVINDCEMCHLANKYYPVDDASVQATTTSHGTAANPYNPNSVAATSANMAVCSSCHQAPLAITHMTQNGGSTIVLKDANGRTLPGATVETCAICHGPGATADVKGVHNIALYRSN